LCNNLIDWEQQICSIAVPTNLLAFRKAAITQLTAQHNSVCYQLQLQLNENAMKNRKAILRVKNQQK